MKMNPDPELERLLAEEKRIEFEDMGRKVHDPMMPALVPPGKFRNGDRVIVNGDVKSPGYPLVTGTVIGTAAWQGWYKNDFGTACLSDNSVNARTIGGYVVALDMPTPLCRNVRVSALVVHADNLRLLNADSF